MQPGVQVLDRGQVVAAVSESDDGAAARVVAGAAAEAGSPLLKSSQERLFAAIGVVPAQHDVELRARRENGDSVQHGVGRRAAFPVDGGAVPHDAVRITEIPGAQHLDAGGDAFGFVGHTEQRFLRPQLLVGGAVRAQAARDRGAGR